ncbi:MAG TPA: LPXTG cell wall anchor domain-containing protein [Actinomycetota bacterium]
MRRALGVLASAFVAVIVMAGTALAEYPPSPKPNTVVKSSGGGGTTAFTGGEISTAVLAVGILAVLGVAALFVARRRSAQGA